MSYPVLRYGWRVAATAALYYGATQVGLELALVRGQVTPLWPPTGIALACLFAWGVRVWPGITIAALLANLPMGPAPAAAALIAAGNSLAPLVSHGLLTMSGFRPDLRRFRDAVQLVLLGAMVGMLVSATIGTGVLVGFKALPEDQAWSTFSVWWTGDAMGVLVVVPLVLAGRTLTWPIRAGMRRLVELGLLVAVTVIVAIVVTRAPIDYHLLFLVFPVLVWAATRMHLLGSALCVLIVVLAAVLAAAQGVGAFTNPDLLARMINLQAFNGAVAMTGLLLACLTTERDEALRSVEQAHAGMARLIASIDTGRGKLLGRPPDAQM